MRAILIVLLMASSTQAAIIEARKADARIWFETVAGLRREVRSDNALKIGTLNTATKTFHIRESTFHFSETAYTKNLRAVRDDDGRINLWQLQFTIPAFSATINPFTFTATDEQYDQRVIPIHGEVEHIDTPSLLRGTWTVTGPTESASGTWATNTASGFSIGGAETSRGGVQRFVLSWRPTIGAQGGAPSDVGVVTVDGYTIDLATGDGVNVPEPSAALLLIVGVSLAIEIRRRSPRHQTSPRFVCAR